MSKVKGPRLASRTWGTRFCCRLGGDFDGFAYFDFVGVGDGIGRGYFAVLVGVTIEALAYFGEVVAGLDDVGLLCAAGGFDFVMQIGVLRIDFLDRVPYAICDDLGLPNFKTLGLWLWHWVLRRVAGAMRPTV